MKTNTNKPQNRENRTRHNRKDDMVSVTFLLPREDCVKAQMLMRQHDMTAAQIFDAGISALFLQ